MKESATPTTPPHSDLAGVLDRNIQSLLQRRIREERRRPLQDRIAARVTAFTGSMAFVYLHLVLFGVWIFINLPGVPLPKFDPSYVVLAMFASVEAIFLSTFVLITHNRMSELADKRDDLNLQMSLLAEHEVTQLIVLVSAIGKKMGLAVADHPELEVLKRDVAPEKVLDQLDHAEAVTREEEAARVATKG